MPIFTYDCPNGHAFDRLARASQIIEDDCDECGEPARRREVYAPAIHVKGATTISMKQDFSEYVEASAEMIDRYDKASGEGRPIAKPNLYRAAKQKAKAQGAKVR